MEHMLDKDVERVLFSEEELHRRVAEIAAEMEDLLDEVAKGEFMILPHEQGRVAWAIKRQNPQIIYDEMTVMCEKMRAKLGAS